MVGTPGSPSFSDENLHEFFAVACTQKPEAWISGIEQRASAFAEAEPIGCMNDRKELPFFVTRENKTQCRWAYRYTSLEKKEPSEPNRTESRADRLSSWVNQGVQKSEKPLDNQNSPENTIDTHSFDYDSTQLAWYCCYRNHLRSEPGAECSEQKGEDHRTITTAIGSAPNANSHRGPCEMPLPFRLSLSSYKQVLFAPIRAQLHESSSLVLLAAPIAVGLQVQQVDGHTSHMVSSSPSRIKTRHGMKPGGRRCRVSYDILIQSTRTNRKKKKRTQEVDGARK